MGRNAASSRKRSGNSRRARFLILCGVAAALFGAPRSVPAQDPSCAHLRDGEHCGVANSGHLVFAVNGRTDKKIRVTVRESWEGGGQSGTTDSTHELSAGGEKQVGCTLGSAAPFFRSSYAIIGCEVL
jgi:hypothetical protein